MILNAHLKGVCFLYHVANLIEILILVPTTFYETEAACSQ